MDTDQPHSQKPENVASPPELAGEGVMLSPREKQLLRRLATGKSDKVIRQQIGGTLKQIGVQRERLVEKLHIQSQEQLVTLAGQLAGRRIGSSKYKKKVRR